MGKVENDMKEILQDPNISNEVYEYLGYLPNEQCIEILKSMDMNVIINFRKQGLGTKVFDYLFVSKPIVYVGKKNTELSCFLRDNICSNEDEIINTLKRLSSTDKDSITKQENIYTRSKLNSKYCDILNNVIQCKNVAAD